MSKFQKINLQLFSEGETTENIETNQQTETNKEGDATTKTYTDDDITSLKEQWQKEQNEENEKKLKEGIAKALEEERRVSKLSKEDKEKEEKQKLLDEIETLKKEKELSKLKEKALNFLSEQKLPHAFLDFILGADENATNQNISNLKTEFDKAVQMQVEERLKGKTPISGGNTDEQGNAQSEFKNALRGIFK